MAVRYAYTSRDERLMWEYLFEKLQDKDDAAYQPKGLKLWRDFEATQRTNKTASSLATHFRKTMYDHIEEARLPVEKVLYIVSQLNMQLSRRQLRTIEHKANISITTDDYGIITAYEKEGKRYHPSLLTRRIPPEDDSMDDEQGYDALELSKKSPKIAGDSRNSDGNSLQTSSKHYSLRKRPNTREDGSTESHKLEKKAEGDVQSSSNEVDDEVMEERRKSACKSDNLGSNSKKVGEDELPAEKESNFIRLGRGKNAMVREVRTDQIECMATFNEEGDVAEPVVISGMQQQCHEGCDSSKTTAFVNDQINTKKVLNEISRNVACSDVSTSTTSTLKRKGETNLLERAIDEELRQLLAHIQTKQQLRGVEKLKVETILRLRAEEAKRFGIGLRNYLRKRQHGQRSSLKQIPAQL